MIEELIASHRLLVYIFLTFLLSGFLLPLLWGQDMPKLKKSSFVYTMVFQALISMVAFTGLIVVFAGDMHWSIGMSIMVVVWAIMMFVEIQKYRGIKRANPNYTGMLAEQKSNFFKVSLIEVLLVVAMVVLMFLKVEGVISI